MTMEVWGRKRRGRRFMRLSRYHTPPTHASGSASTGGAGPRVDRGRGPAPPVALVAGLVILAGVLAGCGSSDSPDTGENGGTKGPSQASGPKVSPAPEGALDLDDDQKSAYKSAVRKYAEYQDFVDDTNHEPQDTKENARRLASLTIPPVTKDFTEGFDELIDNDIHIEGSHKVEWSSPVKVTGDKVIFKQCQSPGTWVAIQGDQKETEDGNTVRKVTVVQRDDGKWYVKNNEVAEDC